eukprot:6407448-Amphidinium_carterae.1
MLIQLNTSGAQQETQGHAERVERKGFEPRDGRRNVPPRAGAIEVIEQLQAAFMQMEQRQQQPQVESGRCGSSTYKSFPSLGGSCCGGGAGTSRREKGLDRHQRFRATTAVTQPGDGAPDICAYLGRRTGPKLSGWGISSCNFYRFGGLGSCDKSGWDGIWLSLGGPLEATFDCNLGK